MARNVFPTSDTIWFLTSVSTANLTKDHLQMNRAASHLNAIPMSTSLSMEAAKDVPLGNTQLLTKKNVKKENALQASLL